jgi:hypothetical protein
MRTSADEMYNGEDRGGSDEWEKEVNTRENIQSESRKKDETGKSGDKKRGGKESR